MGLEQKSFEVVPRELTEQQKKFVHEFTRGDSAGNAEKSAIAAGYSSRTGASIGWALLRHARVSAAIDAALRAEIGSAMTARAVGLMRRVMDDEDAPLKLRTDIACRVVEYSGIVARVGAEKARQTGLDGGAGLGQKRLGEMTREELEGVCRSGAAILAAAASLPPAGQVIEGDKREDFTITDEAETLEPNEDNALT